MAPISLSRPTSCITFAALGPSPIPAPISYHQHLK
jgi:hypothetical protein